MSMSSATTSSRAIVVTISVLMSCSSVLLSSACTQQFSPEDAPERSRQAACGQWLGAVVFEERCDRQVWQDVHAQMEAPGGHTIPFLPLSQCPRLAADHHRRDVQPPTDRDVRGTTLQGPEQFAGRRAGA